MQPLTSRITYANVMSTIAVLGVLGGGGAYAAGMVGPNDIKNNAVYSRHVKDGTLKTADLSPAALAALTRLDITVRSETAEVPDTGGFNATMVCKPGEIAISGGSGPSNGAQGGGTISTDVPAVASTGLPAHAGQVPTAWNIVFTNDTGGTLDITRSVVCLRP